MFKKSAFEDEDFTWQAALNLALASQYAYDDGPVIEAEAKLWGFEAFAFLDRNNSQGFAVADDETVLIGFRGTEGNIADWLGNFRFLATESGGYGSVHRGFYNGYHAVHDQLMGFLHQTKAQHKKVWIAGHSLGGALALIAGAELHKEVPIAGIHTVGQPRVGNNAFLDFYDATFGDRYIRIVNNKDVVPRVPPVYGHTGKLYWFDQDGDLKQVGRTRADDGTQLDSPEPPPLSEAEFAELQEQMRGAQATRGHFSNLVSKAIPGVSDHDCQKYIDHIKEQVKLAEEL